MFRMRTKFAKITKEKTMRSIVQVLSIIAAATLSGLMFSATIV